MLSKLCIRRILILFNIILLASQLTGCGFSLRGNDIMKNKPLSPLNITMAYDLNNNQLKHVIHNVFAENNLNVNFVKKHKFLLRIAAENIDRKVIAINTVGQSIRYNIHYNLIYYLQVNSDNHNKPHYEKRLINVVDSFTGNPSNILIQERAYNDVLFYIRQQAVQRLVFIVLSLHNTI